MRVSWSFCLRGESAEVLDCATSCNALEKKKAIVITNRVVLIMGDIPLRGIDAWTAKTSQKYHNWCKESLRSSPHASPIVIRVWRLPRASREAGIFGPNPGSSCAIRRKRKESRDTGKNLKRNQTYRVRT